jgi:HEAT repeat protein
MVPLKAAGIDRGIGNEPGPLEDSMHRVGDQEAHAGTGAGALLGAIGLACSAPGIVERQYRASVRRAEMAMPDPSGLKRVEGRSLRFKLTAWSIFLVVAGALGYGFLQTPLGRLNRICLLRDLRGAKAALALIEATNDPDFEASHAAQHALRKLGVAAVPALLAGLNQSNAEVARRCQTLIEDMGDKAVPAFAAALSDPDARIRRAAAENLRRLKRGAAPAAADLAKALTDADPAVRKAAIEALAAIGPQSARALAAAGPQAAAALPVLIAALDSPDAELRRSAFGALALMGPAAATAVDPLLRHFDANPSEASEALQHIGSAAASAVPALTAKLNHDDSIVRRCAASVLGAIGAPAASAVPALVRSCGDSDQAVRQASLGALNTISPRHGKTIAALQEDKGDTLLTAGDAAARDAIQNALLDVLRHNVPLRQRAAAALGAAGPSAAGAASALIDLVRNDKEPAVRVAAIAALSRVAPQDAQTIDALGRAIVSTDAKVASEAAVALGKGGPAPTPENRPSTALRPRR